MFQLIVVALIALLVGLDQLTKWLVVNTIGNGIPVPLIEGVFELQYSENRGAAFGIGHNQGPWVRWLFIILTTLIMGFILFLLLSGRFKSYKLVTISGILIVAGGVGNLIDRFFRGYVVDFLYFKWIDFPIFNVADCCVVIGAILLLIFFFFIYEDKPAVKKSAGPEPPEASVAKKEDTDGGQASDGSSGDGGKTN